MHILKRIKTEGCKDSRQVYEYMLNEPIDNRVINKLAGKGVIEIRKLGELQLFSFKTGNWLFLKGMSDDNVIYVTHMKEDDKRAFEFITDILQE